MPQPPVYLDDNGEPIKAAPVYLDDDGNEIGSAPAKPEPPLHPHARIGRAIIDLLTNPEHLPAIGGTLGGIVGSAIPGAGTVLGGAGGAALGGALGSGARAMRRAVDGAEEPTAAELGIDMAAEGARQGVTQGVGAGVSAGVAKAAGPAGRWLYAKALAPSKAIQRDFPVDELLDTAIRENINVTGEGAKQAAAARAASAAAARDIVENAAATGRQDLVKAAEVAGAFKKPREALRGAKSIGKDIAADEAALAARAKRVAASFGGKRAIPATPATPDRVVSLAPAARVDAADVADLAKSQAPASAFGPQADAVTRAREIGPLADVVPPRMLLGSPAVAQEALELVSPGMPAIPGTPARPGAISLVEAQGRKEAAQNAADKAYRARALGHQVNDVDALTDEALATAYRVAIEQRVPQVAAQNANTQSLIGLTRALEDAELRPHVLRWLMSMTQGSGLAMATNPLAGAATAATQYVTTSPRAMGRLGIVLARVGEMPGHIPAALARTLTVALEEDEIAREEEALPTDEELPEDFVPGLTPPEQTAVPSEESPSAAFRLPTRARGGSLASEPQPFALPVRPRGETSTPPTFNLPVRSQDAASTGQIEPGNIDLYNRPKVKNADGTTSTVRSMSINVDGREILIPTVSDDGRVVSDDEAIDIFERTGKHLGVFDSPESATAYASKLHDDYEAGKYEQRSGKRGAAFTLPSRRR